MTDPRTAPQQKTAAVEAVLFEFGGRSANRTMYEEQMATTIVGQRQALAKITEGRGRYVRDPLTHAGNVIEDMQAIATRALAGEYPEPDDD